MNITNIVSSYIGNLTMEPYASYIASVHRKAYTIGIAMNGVNSSTYLSLFVRNYTTIEMPTELTNDSYASQYLQRFILSCKYDQLYNLHNH